MMVLRGVRPLVPAVFVAGAGAFIALRDCRQLGCDCDWVSDGKRLEAPGRIVED